MYEIRVFDSSRRCSCSRVRRPPDSRKELDVSAALLAAHPRRPHLGESSFRGGPWQVVKAFHVRTGALFGHGILRVRSYAHTRSI